MIAALRDGPAGDGVAVAGAGAAARRAAVDPLGWDGIGAVAILLLAAVSLRDRVSDENLGFVLSRVLWWLVYAAVAARLLQRFGTTWLTWTLGQQPALCLLLSVAVVSCLWSLAPLLTFHRSLSLLGTTMLGVFIGYACRPPQVLRVLEWTFALLITCSIVVELLLPTLVGPGVPIGWRGLMGHKNALGAAAVLAAILFLIGTVTRRIHPVSGATLCALCLLTVVATHSRTAFVVLGLGLAVSVYLGTQWGTWCSARTRLRRAALGLVLCVSLLPFVLAPLAPVLGRNDPLNGRLQLWAGAATIIGERPLTGYGYAVVWGRHDATLLPHVAITAHRSAASAHNSIISLATELGIPAAIVACIYLLGAISTASRLFEREPSAAALFGLVFMLAFTVMCFTEAHLLQIHWLFWILFVALSVTMTRALERGTSAEGLHGADG